VYYQTNRLVILQQSKDYASKYASTHGFPVGWKWNIKHRYNIGPEEYVILYEKQNGLCAICFKPETAKSKNGNVRLLSVDHNHKTGIIRGLLCSKHNRGIGMFDDSEEILMNAIKYLKGIV
jgi:hypothetical protein